MTLKTLRQGPPWAARTDSTDTPVTKAERVARVQEIASEFSTHKRWRSHGRNLDREKRHSLGIEIDDYSDDAKLSAAIREYNDPMTECIDRNGSLFHLHNRNVQG